MERKRGMRKVLDVLNSKPVIGALIFIMLSLVSVWAGNVFVNEGNLGVENNLNITGNVTINGNHICNSTVCFSLDELNATGSGGSLGSWGSNGSNIYNVTALVGIGTSNPAYFLEIANSVKALNVSGRLYVNDSGVSMPFSSSNSNLRIGSMEFQGYALNNEWLGENVYFNGAEFRLRQDGEGGLFYFVGDEMQFRQYPAGSAGDILGLSGTTLKFDSTGTFGIGADVSYFPGSYTGSNFFVNSTNLLSTSRITIGNGLTATAYNSFGASPTPDSGQITDVNDVYIADDLEVDGTLYLTGGYAAIVNGDVAENMLTISSRNSLLCHADKTCIGTAYNHTELKYGDVVCVDTKYGQVIKRCDEANSQFAVGVVSNTSVINMGNNEKYSYPIAVAGIVFTKVSNENGNILPGDLLVSASKPGYAMKSDKNPKGIVLGISFDFCDDKYKECVIPMFVALSHSDGLDISVLKDENSKMKQSLCSLGAREWC